MNPHENREAEEELEDFDQYVHVAGADLQVEESGGQRAGLVVGCGVVVERGSGDECGVTQAYSMARTMSSQAQRPARKAATASSLAPFIVQAAVPPRRRQS